VLCPFSGRRIFREQYAGPTDTLVRRPKPDSLQIEHDSRAILTESPRMTIRRATSLRPGQLKHLIRVASVTGRLPERDVALLWLTHTNRYSRHRAGLAGGRRRAVPQRSHQARGVLASGHHKGL
jgi:hypothetical protein